MSARRPTLLPNGPNLAQQWETRFTRRRDVERLHVESPPPTGSVRRLPKSTLVEPRVSSVDLLRDIRIGFHRFSTDPGPGI